MVKQITERTKWIVTALYRSLRVSLLWLRVAKFLSRSLHTHTNVHTEQREVILRHIQHLLQWLSRQQQKCDSFQLLLSFSDTSILNAPIFQCEFILKISNWMNTYIWITCRNIHCHDWLCLHNCFSTTSYKGRHCWFFSSDYFFFVVVFVCFWQVLQKESRGGKCGQTKTDTPRVHQKMSSSPLKAQYVKVYL